MSGVVSCATELAQTLHRLGVRHVFGHRAARSSI